MRRNGLVRARELVRILPAGGVDGGVDPDRAPFWPGLGAQRRNPDFFFLACRFNANHDSCVVLDPNLVDRQLFASHDVRDVPVDIGLSGDPPAAEARRVMKLIRTTRTRNLWIDGRWLDEGRDDNLAAGSSDLEIRWKLNTGVP
jgi:hypothetical protein